MSRENNDNNSQYLSVADISTARFEEGNTWTALCFFTCDDVNNQHAALFSKWNGGSGSAAQFAVRIDQGASPQELEVLGDNSVLFTTAAAVADSTWYLLAITNDGTATDNIAVSLVNMSGTFLIDGTSGTFSSNNTLTAPIRTHVVFHNGSAVGHLDGKISDFAYFTEVLTKGEIRNYLNNPAAVVASKGPGICELYWPMGFSTEPDWSGNDNNPTVNGALSIAANPPIMRAFGYAAELPRVVAAAPSTVKGSIYHSLVYGPHN